MRYPLLELIKPIIDAYPGWSLFGIILLGSSAIAAVPATAKALRGTPKGKV